MPKIPCQKCGTGLDFKPIQRSDLQKKTRYAVCSKEKAGMVALNVGDLPPCRTARELDDWEFKRWLMKQGFIKGAWLFLTPGYRRWLKGRFHKGLPP